MRDIRVLHLEPTDVCQAACPLCSRETDVLFNKTQQNHLCMADILKVFDVEQIVHLNKMFMCGVYGDPAAGQHTLDIYKQFRQLNPSIVLGMNTNGALRNTTWWQELGGIFNRPRDYVVFSIDGLEDTNSIYRKNVDWHKLIENASAFIAAGGSAHWDMLVYRHNEHQVDACEQLARSLGFSWFRAKVSKRGFTDQLQQPINWSVPSTYSTDISCQALNEQSAYIDAAGRMSPCCWIGANRDYVSANFAEIQLSWGSDHPNKVCVKSCSSSNNVNNFANQWRREIQLHV
jgi:hypothetical protein